MYNTCVLLSPVCEGAVPATDLGAGVPPHSLPVFTCRPLSWTPAVGSTPPAYPHSLLGSDRGEDAQTRYAPVFCSVRVRGLILGWILGSPESGSGEGGLKAAAQGGSHGSSQGAWERPEKRWANWMATKGHLHTRRGISLCQHPAGELGSGEGGLGHRQPPSLNWATELAVPGPGGQERLCGLSGEVTRA